MFRKELLEMLLDNPMSIKEIAHLLELPVKDVEDDIKHLQKSIKHMKYRMQISPARCLKCDFQFRKDKLHKPSKCPLCHGTRIEEPQIGITIDDAKAHHS
ncbi:MAG: transcriptional regulator [Gammaproteobacteria bacterium]